MKRTSIILLLSCLVVLVAAMASSASAGGFLGRLGGYRYYDDSWNGDYYNSTWGMPTAMVVPPTARRQSHYGWGVGSTRVTRVSSQFHQGWPGPVTYERSMFRPTPRWPSDTDQFGVYYVRGPR